MLAIIEGASLLSQIELSGKSFWIEATSINTVLESAVEITTKFAKSHKVKLGKIPDFVKAVSGTAELLTKAMTALLKTAIRLSTENNTVTLSCDTEKEFMLIKITAEESTYD